MAHRCCLSSSRAFALLAAAIILIVLIKKNCPLLNEVAREIPLPPAAIGDDGGGPHNKAKLRADTNMPPTYNEFAAAFGRVRADASANLARAKLFVARQLDIFRHNQAFAANQSNYFLRANQFMDWTARELRAHFDSELGRDSVASSAPPSDAAAGRVGPGGDEDGGDPSKSPYDFELLLGEFRQMGGFMLTQFARPDVELPWPREWLERRAREQRAKTPPPPANRPPNPLENLLANFNKPKEGRQPHAAAEQRTSAVAAERYEVDWRKTGCVPAPKDQRECNACYAFASMDLMEFFHCRQLRAQTEFSVQYLIDCGKVAGGGEAHLLNGCKGGKLTSVGEFIRRNGLQLAAERPYEARDGDEDADRDAGQDERAKRNARKNCNHHKEARALANAPAPAATPTRPELKAWHVFRDPQAWFKWALRSPLIVGINVPLDFLAYGGGVHDGATCSEDLVHALLLVGAGRTTGGEPFWLLKNSYGPNWGEAGYFRLSRLAPPKCFNLAVVGRANFDRPQLVA